MTLDLAMISQIRPKKLKQQKKNVNWISSKLKSLCIKRYYNKSEKTTYRMRKMFIDRISDKDLESRIFDSTTKRQPNKNEPVTQSPFSPKKIYKRSKSTWQDAPRH